MLTWMETILVSEHVAIVLMENTVHILQENRKDWTYFDSSKGKETSKTGRI